MKGRARREALLGRAARPRRVLIQQPACSSGGCGGPSFISVPPPLQERMGEHGWGEGDKAASCVRESEEASFAVGRSITHSPGTPTRAARSRGFSPHFVT